jgi:hypothetical protein
MSLLHEVVFGIQGLISCYNSRINYALTGMLQPSGSKESHDPSHRDLDMLSSNCLCSRRELESGEQISLIMDVYKDLKH